MVRCKQFTHRLPVSFLCFLAGVSVGVNKSIVSLPKHAKATDVSKQGTATTSAAAGHEATCGPSYAQRNASISFHATMPNDIFDGDRLSAVFIPGGSVHLARKSKWLTYEGMRCREGSCGDPLEPQVVNDVVLIEGDVVVVFVHTNYFHFVFDTVLQLYPLFMQGVFADCPNATILCFTTGMDQKRTDMMKALNLNFPHGNAIKANRETVYRVQQDSYIILPRHNEYHRKGQFEPYNVWLLDSIRKGLDISESPDLELFLSRRGYRRGIKLEDELFSALQSFIPGLRRVFPDDYTVTKQAATFARAKLVISAHGAALTNTIFSNWNKLVLVEITVRNDNGDYGSFRNDLDVAKHHMLYCESVSCESVAKNPNKRRKECSTWERQIDVDVPHVVAVVKQILSGSTEKRDDFKIPRSATTTRKS